MLSTRFRVAVIKRRTLNRSKTNKNQKISRNIRIIYTEEQHDAKKTDHRI